MTYKKDDILIFLTNEPMAHASKMIGKPIDNCVKTAFEIGIIPFSLVNFYF